MLNTFHIILPNGRKIENKAKTHNDAAQYVTKVFDIANGQQLLVALKDEDTFNVYNIVNKPVAILSGIKEIVKPE